ncbi:uncharacterized protein F4822DRAFT_397944 [Hypoxylon trugodes]|uniref:uncharacterized protein n=1 Tax=Hypoxylon trugodes TaxID=326681 RepID=UPI00219C7392|nr:uncharacterized protein F4822DRAFT_397944 [Hypoxylon trugodes]KAI1389335.1 hypothetical protein F4822DRAFT_397944 [Hypoxylon trugodes]
MVETPRLTYANAGGFLPDGATSLPSPSPSIASIRGAARLPFPRSKPLARGSRKEDYARNYVSERLMHISRRFVKKHGIPDPADEVTGYESMDEVCKDLEEVIDVLWFSGTPSLQIPYLLNVALAFNTYLPAFRPSPRSTFALLKKLDHCFSSLLLGRDIKTGLPLPGFQGNGRGLTRTDMVRCKSIADETRMLVAMIMSDDPDVENFVDGDDDNRVTRRSPLRRNVSVSLSTGFIQSPVFDDEGEDSDEDGRIKFEDVSQFGEDSELSDSEHVPSKRKPETAGLQDEENGDNAKRIKVEEDEDLSPKFSDAAPENRSPETAIDALKPSQPGEKFHWMVDDDDSDSDDEATPNITHNESIIAGATTMSTATPPVQMAADMEQDMDVPDGGDEVDDEEEELQLNVGKVYERTLVQLGKSLGESITNG